MEEKTAPKKQPTGGKCGKKENPVWVAKSDCPLRDKGCFTGASVVKKKEVLPTEFKKASPPLVGGKVM